MEERMRFRTLSLAGALLAGTAAPALAQDQLYVPMNTYRTGPFAGSGVHVADGMRDYITLLNERDGGIGGVKINYEECETGYDTKKSVECYELQKSKGAGIYSPGASGGTLARR